MKDGLILFVYKNNRAINNQYIKTIFNQDIYVNTGSHILLDSEKWSLNDIFDKVRDLNTGQMILTGEKYSKIIKYCVKNNLQVKNITWYDKVDDMDLEYQDELLRELQRDDISMRLKEVLVKNLLSEIKYNEYEEDNHIYSLTIKSPNNNEIIFSRNTHISFEDEDINFIKDILLIFQDK